MPAKKKIGAETSFSYADDGAVSLNEYGAFYRPPTGYNTISDKQNWLESFRALNEDFMLWSRRFLRENMYVPFRSRTTTGSLNEFENNVREVANHNLLSEDVKEINVWRKYDINKKNSHFRYENNIPFWQRSMNIRHADRSNEGLREGNDSFRSSLDNPIYGYDMKEIYKIKNFK